MSIRRRPRGAHAAARATRTSPHRAAVLSLGFAAVATIVVLVLPSVPVTHGATVAVRLVDAGDTTTTTTTTTTVPPATDSPVDSTAPAPTDFTDELENYYATVYAIANAASVPGASSSLASPADFDSQVSALTPDEVDGAYAVASPFVDFGAATSSLTPLVPDATVTAQTYHVRLTSTGAPLSATAVARRVAHDVSPQSLTVIPDTMPTNGSWAMDVSTLNTKYVATCPPGAPTYNDPYGEYDIFAINEGIAAANALYDVASAGFPEEGLPIVGPIDNAVQGAIATVFAAIVLALQIAHDTLSWEQSVSGACQSLDTQLLTLDEDNNAYQTYELLTGVAATGNEIDTNIVSLTNQEAAENDKLTSLEIEEALAAPATSIPQARMELPAADGGLLDATPGVEEIVVNALTALSSTGQLSSNLASRDLGQAEQAQSAGEYKLAFTYYQMAYQAAGA